MSENSPNQPYYLKYRELGWLERRLPEIPDFFSDKVIKRICREVGAGVETDQEDFAKELREIAQAYWVAAMSSPLKIGKGPDLQSPDERIRKLTSTVLNPAEKLVDALADHNLPLLSEWPDTPPSQPPDRERLLEELSLLLGRVRDLTEVLDDRKRSLRYKRRKRFSTTAACCCDFRVESMGSNPSVNHDEFGQNCQTASSLSA